MIDFQSGTISNRVCCIFSLRVARSLFYRREGCAVHCPKGTVHINNTCEFCPAGSYQDEIAQVSCKPCPDQTFTQFPGAQKFNACLRKL
ncbi:unnamed protein product [Gongylonema pulchrum]|uniref:Ephrin_rec_like domain-containing protein n=1 Tax=Gongylonema pulchrum TaxID=637853 RepID=A0A183DBS9_9BILA|nr:unnamed protein product [Gongylonema pulchrum]